MIARLDGLPQKMLDALLKKVMALSLMLEAKVKAYLNAGDRDTASKFALELKRAKDNILNSFLSGGEARLPEEVINCLLQAALVGDDRFTHG